MTQLELVDVASLHVDHDRSVTWGSAPARHEANLEDYGSLIYHVDDRTLVATATPEKIDGRSDPHARRIRDDRRRYTIPAGDFDTVWDVDPADAEGRRVAVYASEGVVALRLVDDLDTLEVSDELVEDVQGTTAHKSTDA